jgi:glycosyltransferase involved in cell wall biosynthesis
VVLFVSDPRRPEKNFALAEAAHRRAAKTVPGLRLRIAADVSPPEMPLWMSASDALLLTSRYEGGPSVVKEAMAVGLPAVCTPVGLLREQLSGLPGLWVAPPEAEALAGSLVDALRSGRVPAGRVAIAPLSLERVAEQVAAVYEAVVG